MKFRFKNMDNKWKEYALAGCICILFFVTITNLETVWSVLTGLFKIFKPVLVGFIIAYLVNPIAMLFNRKLLKKTKREKLRWVFSVILSLIIVLLVIAILIMLLIPQIVDSVVSLANNYTTYVQHLEKFISNIEGPIITQETIHKLIGDISSEEGLFNQIGKFVEENANDILVKTTHIGSAALNGIIGGIFAIYFLFAKQNILNFFKKLFSLIFSKKHYTRFGMLANKFHTIFSRYIVFELLDALIIGFANFFFMLILGMPDKLFISFVVGVTNLAPTFGPIVGAVIGGFILLLLKPSAVIAFLIFTLVIQTIDAYIIKPKLFGGALDVPDVLILLSIIVFGKLLGITGLLMAIPIAAIIVYIYSQRIIPWLESRKRRRDIQEKQDTEHLIGPD